MNTETFQALLHRTTMFAFQAKALLSEAELAKAQKRANLTSLDSWRDASAEEIKEQVELLLECAQKNVNKMAFHRAEKHTHRVLWTSYLIIDKINSFR